MFCLTVSEIPRYWNSPFLAVFQIGKEHVGLKAVTEILQDIQYKVRRCPKQCFLQWAERHWEKGLYGAKRKLSCVSVVKPHVRAIIWWPAWKPQHFTVFRWYTFFVLLSFSGGQKVSSIPVTDCKSYLYSDFHGVGVSASTATCLVNTSSHISKLTWF